MKQIQRTPSPREGLYWQLSPAKRCCISLEPQNSPRRHPSLSCCGLIVRESPRDPTPSAINRNRSFGRALSFQLYQAAPSCANRQFVNVETMALVQ